MKRQGIVRVCKSAGTETWTGAATETPMFDRGFTGHEHLYAFGLINMNGRMYDPLMSSFLSVDAYVQSPDNAQNFNRYAYCLNNPLKYVDPSGWLMQGAMMGTPGQGVHDWGNSLHAILEPRDIENGYLSDDFILAMWREGDNLDGGDGSVGGGGSNLDGGQEGGGEKYCVFGLGIPDSRNLKGSGACLFASMGLLCKRFDIWDMNPQYWEKKEEEYYQMKNSDSGQERESNHGYLFKNTLDFIRWVGEDKGIEIDIQMIPFEDIPKADDEGLQVLVLSSLIDPTLINNNNGVSGHAAVINVFERNKYGSIYITFGDPSPKPIMPLAYRNSLGSPPDGFSGWGFFKINIYRP